MNEKHGQKSEVVERSQFNDLVDLAMGRLSPEDSLKAFEELERTHDVSKDLDVIVDLIHLASDPRENVFSSSDRLRSPWWRFVALWIRERSAIHPILYPSGIVAGFLIALALLLAIFIPKGNRYEELLGIDRTVFEWNIRGVGDRDVAIGYHFFTEGEYSKCILHLERYIRTHAVSEIGGYIHYSLGSVYLLSSRKSNLPHMTTYDGARIRSGLAELEISGLQTSSPRLREESRFLRSKGYLMLELADSAIAELDSVFVMNGVRKSEASQMIDRIRSLDSKGPK